MVFKVFSPVQSSECSIKSGCATFGEKLRKSYSGNTSSDENENTLFPQQLWKNLLLPYPTPLNKQPSAAWLSSPLPLVNTWTIMRCLNIRAGTILSTLLGDKIAFFWWRRRCVRISSEGREDEMLKVTLYPHKIIHSALIQWGSFAFFGFPLTFSFFWSTIECLPCVWLCKALYLWGGVFSRHLSRLTHSRVTISLLSLTP